MRQVLLVKTGKLKHMGLNDLLRVRARSECLLIIPPVPRQALKAQESAPLGRLASLTQDLKVMALLALSNLCQRLLVCGKQGWSGEGLLGWQGFPPLPPLPCLGVGNTGFLGLHFSPPHPPHLWAVSVLGMEPSPRLCDAARQASPPPAPGSPSVPSPGGVLNPLKNVSGQTRLRLA